MLMISVVVGAAYISYAQPQGPWYTAVYDSSVTDAFSASTQYADAIAENNENVATVYIEKRQDVAALRTSNVILLDPQGVPLCLRP